MGLDITAYSKVEFVESLPSYDAFEAKYDGQEHIYIYQNPDFPERMPPIVANGVYKIHGDSLSFRAGSYSGYGEWRRQLALLALGVAAENVWGQRQGYAGSAFYELIDFSDCEGIIGTDAARKLANDFDRFQAQVDQHDNHYFHEKYAAWRKACHLAADGGFIEFH